MFDVLASSFMTAARTDSVARPEGSGNRHRVAHPYDRDPEQSGVPKRAWLSSMALLLSASL